MKMDMTEAHDPIQRFRLHRQIAERLLANIREGEFPPGTQLPSEQALMRRYGVGRVAVREAMQVLEGMGAIAISHGERARVLAPTAARILSKFGAAMAHLLRAEPANLDHLKAARLEFERVMVRRAAVRATAEDIVALTGAVAALREAGTGEPFLRADMRFHCMIAGLSGNPLYPVLLEAMLDWLSAFHVSHVHVHGLEALTIAEHEAILDGIRAHAADAAETAITQHLTRAHDLYRLHQSNIR